MYIGVTDGLGQIRNNDFLSHGRLAGLGYAPPRGLVLLRHFHVPFDGTSNLFLPRQLRPENLEPQFDVKDTLLQDGLRSILKQDPFRNLLVDKTASRAHLSDKLRIALVDLTGNKLFKPLFAGYGSTVPMPAASLVKILALYAAFQLKYDLSHLASSSNPPLGTKDTLIRAAVKAGYPGKNGELLELFEFKDNSMNGVEITFSSAAWDHLEKTVGAARNSCGCCSNGSSTWLIHHLGYPYIASVAWQSGLRHPKTKGLWLRRDFGTLAECQSRQWRWTLLPNAQRRPEARWAPEWGSSPLNTFPHECNALSVSRFFTLLAQGRLVDYQSSQQLREDILTKGYSGAFGPAFPGLIISSKVGRLKPPEGSLDHQGAVIQRNSGGKQIHYVAVVLTRQVERDSGIVRELVLKLDGLVSSLN